MYTYPLTNARPSQGDISLSVPRHIFSPCPPNVALTVHQIQPYAQSSTACPVKNLIPLFTQSVAVASLMTCRNMNVLSVDGKVLEQNLERHHVRTKEHSVGFHWEEFQAFRTFYLTCICRWKVPLRILEGGSRGYYVRNVWLAHLDSSNATV